MPLTTYVAGDVLTALSLNDNFTFAAANPPASPSGLTFINGQTITAAASFSLPNDTFTATFTNYMVFIQGASSGSGQNLQLRFRTAGTDNSTSNYFGCRINGSAGGSITGTGTNAQTSFLFSTTGNSSGTVINVLGPKLAEKTNHNGSSDRAGEPTFFGGNFNGSTAFDSLTILVGGGQTFTGQVQTYGLALT